MPTGERWPPVHDEEELAKQIEELATRPSRSEWFYQRLDDNDAVGCQGDVLALQAPVPVLDSLGEVRLGGDRSHWLVIGNTCDIDRTIDEVPWVPIVPIIDAREFGRWNANFERDLKAFRLARQFHVPSWLVADGERCWFADLVQPVTLHKAALRGPARVEARLSFPAWVLLNACLVRYLARVDRRETP